MKICPKCKGEMKRSQRVRKDGRGLEKPVFRCGCGWAHEEGAKEGFWTK